MNNWAGCRAPSRTTGDGALGGQKLESLKCRHNNIKKKTKISSWVARKSRKRDLGVKKKRVSYVDASVSVVIMSERRRERVSGQFCFKAKGGHSVYDMSKSKKEKKKVDS